MAFSAMKQWMEYLWYMYTKLFEAHKFGGTVIWPLFFEFPTVHIEDSYESSFMVGEALKVSPKLTEGKTKISSAFPGGVSFISLIEYNTVVKAKYDQMVDLEPMDT